MLPPLNPKLMLRNYFTTAFRHLLNHKSSAFIHIIGLALGMACLLVILVVVRYERSYDQFHSDAERIYRIVRVSQGDGETEYRAGVAYTVPAALKEGLTAVQKVAATMYIGDMQVSIVDEVRQQFQEGEGITFADSDFFRLFDFKDADVRWIAGNSETALKEPFTVVLTQSLADEYFPAESALGKTLTLDNLLNVTVTGVVSDFPPNSDFPFRILVSHATLNTEVLMKDSFSSWYSVSDEHQCFVLLNEGVTPEEAEAQILRIHTAQVDERLAKTRLYKLQPLREMHTDARFGNYRSRTVSPETIWALLIVGLFIIGTAVINVVNLSTAQSVLRSKEVGIRKTMGSSRTQLTAQFLGETFIITFVAGILALGTAELATVYAGDLLYIGDNQALLADPFYTVLSAGYRRWSYPVGGYISCAADVGL